MSDLHVWFSVTHNYFAVAASPEDANALLDEYARPKTRRTGTAPDGHAVTLAWEQQPDLECMVLWFSSGLERSFATLEEAGEARATRFEKTHRAWSTRLGRGAARRRCPYLQSDDRWRAWMEAALARESAAEAPPAAEAENVQRVNETRMASPPADHAALLRELVAYVDGDAFAHSHTDVVNWLSEFAEQARKAVG